MDIPIPYVSKNSGDVYSSPFPGAYIIKYVLTGNNSRFTPIYHSVGRIINDSNYDIPANQGRPRDINNSFDASNNISGYETHIITTDSDNATHFTGSIMVLPGFKLIVYWRVDFTEPNDNTSDTSYKITVDNTDGKDMKFHSITSGTNIGGFKLFKKTHNGHTREVFPYKKYTYSNVGGGTLEVHASVTEDSNDSNSKRYDFSNNIIEFYDVGRIYYTHPSNNSVDVSCLIVGGGGGGGGCVLSGGSVQSTGSFWRQGSGGGGGGGFGEGNFQILPNVTYEISVGRGGPGSNYHNANSTGIPGGDSTIIDFSNNTTIISYGGGAGMLHHNSNESGGSGGGEMYNNDSNQHVRNDSDLKKGALLDYPLPEYTNTSMVFYGNYGGDVVSYESAGGGGAGGAGSVPGSTQEDFTNSNLGYSGPHQGGDGGAGKIWAASNDTTTKYAGGGGGGGANTSTNGYWATGAHGGGNFHGGGGGGSGFTGANWVTASGFSGCIKFKLPTT